MMGFTISNIPMFHHSKLSFILSDKAADRTIVRSFTLRREETARKLLHLPVIGDALTTSSLAFTGFISTGASGFVFF
jgi:hypothetical protein